MVLPDYVLALAPLATGTQCFVTFVNCECCSS